MITIKIDTSAADRLLLAASKQARFAMAVALTRTSKAVEKELQGEIASKLDNPTPWIRKGTYTKSAKPQTLTAEVGIKDRQALYMKEHFSAGKRNQKPFEKVLSSMGLLPGGYKTVYGAGMKLDARGNPTRTQLREMIGSLRTGIGAAKGRGKGVKLTTYIALGPGNRAGIAPGIYMRVQQKIMPVLVYVDSASYRKRMDMGTMARKVVARDFDRLFRAAYQQAMQTARPG
jgi:hypothetical protein